VVFSTATNHQICRDTGVSATEALQLAEDRPLWRAIATAGGFVKCFASWWWWYDAVICRRSRTRCVLSRQTSVQTSCWRTRLYCIPPSTSRRTTLTLLSLSHRTRAQHAGTVPKAVVVVQPRSARVQS